jgi:hypothetical protein
MLIKCSFNYFLLQKVTGSQLVDTFHATIRRGLLRVASGDAARDNAGIVFHNR